MFEEKIKVQYLGQSGYTLLCLLAIDAILNSSCLPEKAIVVSHRSGPDSKVDDHLFLFRNWGHFPLIVVPSGFASGYPGEGPKGFSLALCLIRDKGIPLYGVYVPKYIFEALDKGKIDFPDHPIIKEIELRSEELRFPWPLWILEEDENLLARGLIWRKCYWRNPKANEIVEALGKISDFFDSAAQRLRLALAKLRTENREEWQSTGILARDAWIEFAKNLCDVKCVDITDIPKDKAIYMLRKAGVEDELIGLAKGALDLSLKVQHDRNVLQSIAMAAVVSSIMAMQAIIERELKMKQIF